MPSGPGALSGLMSNRALLISCSDGSSKSNLLSVLDTVSDIKRREVSNSVGEEVEKRSRKDLLNSHVLHFDFTLYQLPMFVFDTNYLILSSSLFCSGMMKFCVPVPIFVPLILVFLFREIIFFPKSQNQLSPQILQFFCCGEFIVLCQVYLILYLLNQNRRV